MAEQLLDKPFILRHCKRCGDWGVLREGDELTLGETRGCDPHDLEDIPLVPQQEIGRLQEEVSAQRLQVAAEESAHRKDNEYLLARAETAEAERDAAVAEGKEREARLLAKGNEGERALTEAAKWLHDEFASLDSSSPGWGLAWHQMTDDEKAHWQSRATELLIVAQRPSTPEAGDELIESVGLRSTPPLDEWLKEKHDEAIRELGQARSNQPEYIRWNARVAAFDEVLEALAEHRKESGDG